MLTTYSSVKNKFGIVGLDQLMFNGLWCDSPGCEGDILLLGDVYVPYFHDWNLIPDKGNYDVCLIWNQNT